MQRAMLQIAWAVILDLPAADSFTDRHHSPERMFIDFEKIIERTVMNFTINFLLACPEEFFSSDALINAVKCNSKADALASTEEVLKVFSDWKPLKHPFKVDAFDSGVVEKMNEPIKYWLRKVEYLMTNQLAEKWKTMESALNKAFTQLKEAIYSSDLIDACVRKIAQILVIMVKRPKELFHSEPWIATCDTLVDHIKDHVKIDKKLCERIKSQKFYKKTVPSNLVVEVGKTLQNQNVMAALMSPKIFEKMSKPMIQMVQSFEKSFMANILEEMTQKER